VVTDDEHADDVRSLVGRIASLRAAVVAPGQRWTRVCSAAPIPLADLGPRDPAWLFYTSGTTGRGHARSGDPPESRHVAGDVPLLGFGLPVSGSWATPQMMRHIARRAEDLVALSYVAGHTERIRLGTATLCAPFTAPAVLAKSPTSLDGLSGGRLTVGLGMGWVPQEYSPQACLSSDGGARLRRGSQLPSGT
jgi:Luciferase-like monooxygenase